MTLGYDVTHVVESVCGGEKFTAALGPSGVHEDRKIDYLPSRHPLTRA